MIHRRLIHFLALTIFVFAAPGDLFAQTTQLSGVGRSSTPWCQVPQDGRRQQGHGRAWQRGCDGLKHGTCPGQHFDSDTANRDSHMMENGEGEKVPMASVRAALPASSYRRSGTIKVAVQSLVELHGVSVSHPKKNRTIDTWNQGWHAFSHQLRLHESLTAHKIELPKPDVRGR